MKKIIDGRRYDTETATLIGDYSNGGSWRDFGHVEESLYRKRTGEYFLAGKGGPQTKYAKAVDANSWTRGEKVIPLTYEGAREWAEMRLDADKYEAEFTVIDDKANQILIKAGQAIRKLREEAGLTQTQLADKIGTTQSMLGKYERGELDFSLTRLVEIARALEITPDKIMGYK